MTNLLVGIACIAGLYLVTAYLKRWWPFAGVPVTPRPTSGQDAIIETLVFETPAVPGSFPNVFSQAPLSPELRQGIIDAFEERTRKARERGWTKGFDPAQYTIYVFPSVRDHDSSGTYAPSFQVFIEPGSWYDGSVYDQEPDSPGGWIFAAEQVFTRGNELTNAFVIAMNDRREYTQIATANALDHLFAWHNDRALYERTKDHSQGGGHPLW